MKNIKISVLIFILMFSFFVTFAQTGKLKIFSEISGIEIYIDETLQGKDKAEFNSVEIGSHYLKVLKDGAMIYGSIVTITENAVTTVVIQNNEQVQNKIAQTKTSEIALYRTKKLSVVWTNQYKWKILSGGTTVLSVRKLAELTNDLETLERLKREERSTNIRSLCVGSSCVAGIASTIFIICELASDDPIFDFSVPTYSILLTAGIASEILSLVLATGNHFPPTSFNYANTQVNKYNSNLKKELGLPETFE